MINEDTKIANSVLQQHLLQEPHPDKGQQPPLQLGGEEKQSINNSIC